MKTNKLIIDEIEIEIQQKKIKHFYLRIFPGGKVCASVPKSMPEDIMSRLIRDRLSWIREKREKLKKRPPKQETKYVSGENIFIWGESYPLEIRISKLKSRVVLEKDRLILEVGESSTKEQREKLLTNWYRDKLKEKVPALLEQWEKIIGVSVLEWRIKNMKTRWGTCNIRSRRIWLNLQLAKKPPQCLEYVLVHELVHLLERNHNKIFKAHMDRFLPNWPLLKDELNKFGN